MFKTLKAKLIGLVTLVAVTANNAMAEVLSAEQKTELTTSLTSGYNEYVGLLVAVVAIVIPVVLIGRFLWNRLGKGGNA